MEATIRRRKSYKMFKELYKFLEEGKDVFQIMDYVHDEILNKNRYYGSKLIADYAEESLGLLQQDIINGDV